MGYSRFTFVEMTISILSKLERAKFLESNSFVLLAYASLVAPRALLQWLLACLNFTLESQELSFWYKWNEWGLTWYFLWGIYTSIPNWSHSQNSLAAAEALRYPQQDILPWNISQMMTKTIPISTRIVISYAMKLGIPLWI